MAEGKQSRIRDVVARLGIAAAAALSSTAEGQEAYYPLNANTLDSVGGHHGQLVSGTYVPGAFGQAVRLDGDGDRVELPAGIISGPLASWSFWIFPRSCGPTDPRIIDDGGGGSGVGVALNVRPADCGLGLQISRTTSADPLAVSVSGLLSLGVWQHIAVVFDRGNVSFYRDGVLRSTATAAPTIILSSMPAAIGGRLVGSARWLNSDIDEFKLWRVALTAQQAAAEAGAPPPPPPPPPPTGCTYDRERAWANVTRTPAQKCYDSQALSGALATLPSGSSWIVLSDGAVISQSNADTLRLAASFSKSLIGLAVAMCVDDGSCDWQDYDEELNHRAGWTNTGGNPPCVDGGTAGSWAYSTCGFSRAADALASAVGVNLASYLNAKLAPLGVGIEWDGSHGAGQDARMSVRNAAKILLMLARRGSWQGQMILTETAVDDLVGAGCNPAVPFVFPAQYAQPIGVDPPLVYCRGFWLTNHHHLAGIAQGGFGGQGGFDGQGFVGYVLDRDTVVVTAGPDARPAPGGQNQIDGQPHAEIIGARTGIGLQ